MGVPPQSRVILYDPVRSADINDQRAADVPSSVIPLFCAQPAIARNAVPRGKRGTEGHVWNAALGLVLSDRKKED
jgi:hypothetical protein